MGISSDSAIVHIIQILGFGLAFAFDASLWLRYLRAPQDTRRRALSDAVVVLLLILYMLFISLWATSTHS